MISTHPHLSDIVGNLKNRDLPCPEIAVVLGSGLGALADQVDAPVEISYEDIPGFFKTGIPGHHGRLLFGTLEKVPVVLFAGRVHYYEGYAFSDVTLSVQIAKALGTRAVALSCSVGGLNPAYAPGDFMLIADHINWQGSNPLKELIATSKSNFFEQGPSPFLDMCGAYRTDLYPPLLDKAKELGARLHKGVLAAVVGPIYETPAEVRMLQILGADSVCMSTVPEAIMARYLGLEVAGLSMITNAAHAQRETGPSHSEVLAVSREASPAFVELMKSLIRLL